MRKRWVTWFCWLVISLAFSFSILANDLDTIGVTLLRTIDPTLKGTGIRVAQPEAGSPAWQVNPTAVSQPPELFTWYSIDGSATTFPNSLGSESDHANAVGNNFYGAGSGVATDVLHVDNYEGNYFFETIIPTGSAIPAKVVNQSFIVDAGSQQVIDSTYDNALTLPSLFLLRNFFVIRISFRDCVFKCPSKFPLLKTTRAFARA